MRKAAVDGHRCWYSPSYATQSNGLKPTFTTRLNDIALLNKSSHTYGGQHLPYWIKQCYLLL